MKSCKFLTVVLFALITFSTNCCEGIEVLDEIYNKNPFLRKSNEVTQNQSGLQGQKDESPSEEEDEESDETESNGDLPSHKNSEQ